MASVSWVGGIDYYDPEAQLLFYRLARISPSLRRSSSTSFSPSTGDEMSCTVGDCFVWEEQQQQSFRVVRILSLFQCQQGGKHGLVFVFGSGQPPALTPPSSRLEGSAQEKEEEENVSGACLCRLLVLRSFGAIDSYCNSYLHVLPLNELVSPATVVASRHLPRQSFVDLFGSKGNRQASGSNGGLLVSPECRSFFKRTALAAAPRYATPRKGNKPSPSPPSVTTRLSEGAAGPDVLSETAEIDTAIRNLVKRMLSDASSFFEIEPACRFCMLEASFPSPSLGQGKNSVDSNGFGVHVGENPREAPLFIVEVPSYAPIATVVPSLKRTKHVDDRNGTFFDTPVNEAKGDNVLHEMNFGRLLHRCGKTAESSGETEESLLTSLPIGWVTVSIEVATSYQSSSSAAAAAAAGDSENSVATSWGRKGKGKGTRGRGRGKGKSAGDERKINSTTVTAEETGGVANDKPLQTTYLQQNDQQLLTGSDTVIQDENPSNDSAAQPEEQPFSMDPLVEEKIEETYHPHSALVPFNTEKEESSLLSVADPVSSKQKMISNRKIGPKQKEKKKTGMPPQTVVLDVEEILMADSERKEDEEGEKEGPFSPPIAAHHQRSSGAKIGEGKTPDMNEVIESKNKRRTTTTASQPHQRKHNEKKQAHEETAFVNKELLKLENTAAAVSLPRDRSLSAHGERGSIYSPQQQKALTSKQAASPRDKQEEKTKKTGNSAAPAAAVATLSEAKKKTKKDATEKPNKYRKAEDEEEDDEEARDPFLLSAEENVSSPSFSASKRKDKKQETKNKPKMEVPQRKRGRGGNDEDDEMEEEETKTRGRKEHQKPEEDHRHKKTSSSFAAAAATGTSRRKGLREVEEIEDDDDDEVEEVRNVKGRKAALPPAPSTATAGNKKATERKDLQHEKQNLSAVTSSNLPQRKKERDGDETTNKKNNNTKSSGTKGQSPHAVPATSAERSNYTAGNRKPEPAVAASRSSPVKNHWGGERQLPASMLRVSDAFRSYFQT